MDFDNFSIEAELALVRLGVEPSQFSRLARGEPMAFLLSEAEDGTIAVAILTPEGRLRVGIYTIKHVGGGLLDFLRFDSLAQATARTLGLEDVEILGLEITCPRLQAVLERGGFHATTMPVPEELGGGIFQAISRIQAIV